MKIFHTVEYTMSDGQQSLRASFPDGTWTHWQFATPGRQGTIFHIDQSQLQMK
jgi:hypothetical protein